MIRLVYDTESDGFASEATTVHCLGIIDADTEEATEYFGDTLDDGIRRLEQADVRIGHNAQRHDERLLRRLRRFQPKAGSTLLDTMVTARLMYPSLKETDGALIDRKRLPAELRGKHSIQAWGYRLGEPKGDYASVMREEALALGITDEAEIFRFIWGTYRPQMGGYMMQDCKVNLALFRFLKTEKYSQPAIELEHRTARVCDAIEEAGAPFDLEAAQRLHVELSERKYQIEQKLKAQFGYWFEPVSPDPTKALFRPKQPNARLGYWGDGDHRLGTFKGYPCTKIKPVEFNPSSRGHIIKKLLQRGWKPNKFTPSGNPKLDEETLEMVVVRYPELDGIGEYLMLDKRIGQLVGTDNSLMERVGADGRIHGAINPMGTKTSRGAHFQPNLGQVPSAKKPYGHQFRALFGCGPGLPTGWCMVGADQEGLELRGLAHYLAKHDGGKYAEVVCHGDPHWLHAGVMGLVPQGTERDKAAKDTPPTDKQTLHTIIREDGSKRVIYSYIYGAGDEKIGTIILEALLNAKKRAGTSGEELFAEFFGAGIKTKVIKKVGKTIRNRFATRIEGFAKLKMAIAKQVATNGRLKGLDGRLVPVMSDHSALNYLIQSAGAIICKRWLCDAFDECCARFKLGWNGDFCFVLWVHDEVQVCCRTEIADEIAAILVRCAERAGDSYGFRVPLGSKATRGRSWDDTH